MMYKHPKVLKKFNINLLVTHVTQNMHNFFKINLDVKHITSYQLI